DLIKIVVTFSLGGGLMVESAKQVLENDSLEWDLRSMTSSILIRDVGIM
ncbi:hypothetical protein SCG7109_AU_00300, partial [Chlamydiales bacterium SCGC AG-110-M15]